MEAVEETVIGLKLSLIAMLLAQVDNLRAARAEVNIIKICFSFTQGNKEIFHVDQQITTWSQ